MQLAIISRIVERARSPANLIVVQCVVLDDDVHVYFLDPPNTTPRVVRFIAEPCAWHRWQRALLEYRSHTCALKCRGDGWQCGRLLEIRHPGEARFAWLVLCWSPYRSSRCRRRRQHRRRPTWRGSLDGLRSGG